MVYNRKTTYSLHFPLEQIVQGRKTQGRIMNAMGVLLEVLTMLGVKDIIGGGCVEGKDVWLHFLSERARDQAYSILSVPSGYDAKIVDLIKRVKSLALDEDDNDIPF